MGYKPTSVNPIDLPPKAVTAVLTEASIAAATTTALGDCTAIDLNSGAWTLALTVKVTYNGLATRGCKIHVRTSYDNTDYDTEDWTTWTPQFTVGSSIQETTVYNTDPMYIKVLVENLDPAQTITSVTVTATVG